MNGKLMGLIPIDRNHTIVQLKVDTAIQDLEKFYEKALTVLLKVTKKHRSLDANGMYWKLLTELANKLQMSRNELHNRMLDRYGQLEFNGDSPIQVLLPDTDKADREALEKETYHLKLTSEIDGGRRVYLLLRGSHTYNTEEFSYLLNGLIDECRQQGIETQTDDEIAHIMSLYGENNEKHHAK